jgi:Histidine kinase-, DNA gyrase B-, and HSP90-like ATPase
MSNTDFASSDRSETLPEGAADAQSPNWASDAPRGGRAVLNRVLKESTAVPLFLAQTFVQSLRDVGYDSTTSALCEHVDNSIEAGAKEVRVFFRQKGRNGEYHTDIMVYDNGRGMAPNVLQVATSFGGSMTYGSRSGIGRFGMGMKTAGLSMSPVVEIYSWQEPKAIYRMILDTNEIGRDTKNLVALAKPDFLADFGDDIVEFFIRPMSFPKDRNEQNLVAPEGVNLIEALGRSGTIVYMPDCDRLSYAKAQTLVEHAVKEMARVYRREIAKGLKLYVNNRRVRAIDPTFSMPNAWHDKIEGLGVKTSRLVHAKKIKIARRPNSADTFDITVKLFALPIEEWSSLPRKIQKNDMGIFSGHNISVLRNDREVFAGYISDIMQRHGDANWFRIEIDFPGELDEAFGVATNKQGVRPKGYVIDAINAEIGDDIAAIRDEIKRFQSKRATESRRSLPSQSEAKANESDAFQPEPFELELTDEQKTQIEANLKGLAIALKRETESDEEAFERVKSSRYLITYKHDEYWPFYHVENKFGRIILTINTAHPFFTELYEPLLKIGGSEATEDGVVEPSTAQPPQGPVVILELLLLSLARTQGVMSRDNPDAAKIFDVFRRKWSETFRIQITH